MALARVNLKSGLRPYCISARFWWARFSIMIPGTEVVRASLYDRSHISLRLHSGLNSARMSLQIWL